MNLSLVFENKFDSLTSRETSSVELSNGLIGLEPFLFGFLGLTEEFIFKSAFVGLTKYLLLALV